MELFGFIFSWVELSIFAVLLVTFIYQIYFYLRYMNGIVRRNKKVKKNNVTFTQAQQPVSVIIAAKNEEENIRKFLPAILEQNYPEYEVIVINDASDDDTGIVLEELKEKYPHLRTSFVPEGTRNISSKKLAITLGVKAAKYDILLFTDADCIPESTDWISSMTRNFTPETEFVLGYGAYLKEKGFLNRMITFDTLFIGSQYLGMAYSGKPYMGVGRNLAYRKEVFFRLKGFSANLDILSGDDDLIVNKAANKGNTKIEACLDSITWSEPKKTFRVWYYQKTRHLSASDRYKKKSKFRLGIEPLTRGIFYLAFILLMCFGGMIPMIAGGSLFLLRFLTQLIIINRNSSYFKGRGYYLTLPLFDILLPLINLFIMISGDSKKHSHRW